MSLAGAKQILRDEKGISFAYLFGSRARKTHRKDSDWDFACYFKHPPKDGPHGKKYHSLYWTLSKELKTDAVDIVILNFAEPLLSHQILSEGIELFCKEKVTYVDYFVRLMQKVSDSQYILKTYLEAQKSKRYGK